MDIVAAFSQVYNENQEQKAEQKDLKNMQFCQKSSMFRVIEKESVHRQQRKQS
jgi:hypothetical protein